MRRRAAGADRHCMTTSTSTSTERRRWSDFLRFLAPGPIALGMHSCVDPAVWHATWQGVGAERLAVQPPAEAQEVARGRER